jgi:hypothetical protein
MTDGRLGTHARRPRHVRDFLAQVVGTVGRWLHFAGRFGRGRRAEAFPAIPFPIVIPLGETMVLQPE